MIIDRTKKRAVREAFGKALVDLGKINNNIVVLDADLAASTQTKLFAKEFPERFFDMGIAEQNMIGTAAGLSVTGKIPFAASFAVFATGRTYDQIRNGICYPKFNVKIVGTHGGVTVGEDGASHQALEDISLMRGIPNMTVLVPADYAETYSAVKYAAEHEGPFYIRVARTSLPDIFDDGIKLDTSIKCLKEGSDLTLITNGETLVECIDATNILKEKGIDVELLHSPFIKPFDSASLIKSAKKTGRVVSVENHSINGGLGSIVCEVLSENYPVSVLRIGVKDVFGKSGKASELLKHYGLDSESIVSKIVEMVK